MKRFAAGIFIGMMLCVSSAACVRAADGDNYMGLDIARQGGDETVGYQQDRVAPNRGFYTPGIVC